MESSFVAELTRKLQENGSAFTLALNWIEQRLAEEGQSTTLLIQLENQKQAADQVSISNSISSLRFLSTTDWRDFVESTSVVEQVLLQDMHGTYSQMDFHYPRPIPSCGGKNCQEQRVIRKGSSRNGYSISAENG